MLCYIFPALSLHCITSSTIQERVSFFTSFTRVNGSECASVSEQIFFFLSFFLDSGAPGGQRWRGGAGRRKRGFGRKEGEEKESAEGREREREGELF